MADSVTSSDLAHELGLHHETARSHLREFFEEQEGHPAPEELTQGQADAFLVWHATRFGTAG
jgi:predicted ArsR family transcriptional regulator